MELDRFLPARGHRIPHKRAYGTREENLNAIVQFISGRFRVRQLVRENSLSAAARLGRIHCVIR